MSRVEPPRATALEDVRGRVLGLRLEDRPAGPDRAAEDVAGAVVRPPDRLHDHRLIARGHDLEPPLCRLDRAVEREVRPRERHRVGRAQVALRRAELDLALRGR